MFCPSCGSELTEQSKFCNVCGKGLTASVSASELGERAKTASKDAFEAFKIFFINPLGGLSKVYENLGEQKAFSVGIVFSIVFILTTLIGVLMLLPSFLTPDFADILKMIFAILILPACMYAILMLLRTVVKANGNYKSDFFLTGAAILPLGFLFLVSGMLSLGNLEIIFAFTLYAISFTILILYDGCTKISKISETASTFSIPLVILLSIWLTKVIFFALVLRT